MIFTDTITMDMHDGTINQYQAWGHRFIKHRPSGKRLQKTMENHHAMKMGKSTMPMAIFNSKPLVYQRVKLMRTMVFIIVIYIYSQKPK